MSSAKSVVLVVAALAVLLFAVPSASAAGRAARRARLPRTATQARAGPRHAVRAQRRAGAPRPAPAAAEPQALDGRPAALPRDGAAEVLLAHLAERRDLRRPHPRAPATSRAPAAGPSARTSPTARAPLDAALDRPRVDEQPAAPREHPQRLLPLDRDRHRLGHPGRRRRRHLHHRLRPPLLQATAASPRPPRRGPTRGCPRSGRARPPRPLAGRRATARCPRTSSGSAPPIVRPPSKRSKTRGSMYEARQTAGVLPR